MSIFGSRYIMKNLAKVEDDLLQSNIYCGKKNAPQTCINKILKKKKRNLWIHPQKGNGWLFLCHLIRITTEGGKKTIHYQGRGMHNRLNFKKGPKNNLKAF